MLEYLGPFNCVQAIVIFVCKQIIYSMYKEDLALNNLQRLICHKTQPNKQMINTK